MGQDKIDTHKLDFILDKCSAFIAPGGTYWYNFDKYIINYAIAKNKPLLAICAGFQALCSVDSTDSSKFDISKKYHNNYHHNNNLVYAHYINIKSNTKLKKILNKTKIYVNSLHYNYIDINNKFNNLKISAVSEDNIIEAVEFPGKKFIVGLEWHPEYLLDSNSKKIFQSFISSIKEPN